MQTGHPRWWPLATGDCLHLNSLKSTLVTSFASSAAPFRYSLSHVARSCDTRQPRKFYWTELAQGARLTSNQGDRQLVSLLHTQSHTGMHTQCTRTTHMCTRLWAQLCTCTPAPMRTLHIYAHACTPAHKHTHMCTYRSTRLLLTLKPRTAGEPQCGWIPQNPGRGWRSGSLPHNPPPPRTGCPQVCVGCEVPHLRAQASVGRGLSWMGQVSPRAPAPRGGADQCVSSRGQFQLRARPPAARTLDERHARWRSHSRCDVSGKRFSIVNNDHLFIVRTPPKHQPSSKRRSRLCPSRFQGLTSGAAVRGGS